MLQHFHSDNSLLKVKFNIRYGIPASVFRLFSVRCEMWCRLYEVVKVQYNCYKYKH